MRFFNLPAELVVAIATNWLNSKAMLKYLKAMRFENSFKASFFLTEIFRILSSSESEESTQCQRLFVIFFSNLPPNIQSGMTITAAVEENLYKCMQTPYSSPEHRAQMLYLINVLKGRPRVLSKTFSNFFESQEKRKKAKPLEHATQILENSLRENEHNVSHDWPRLLTQINNDNSLTSAFAGLKKARCHLAQKEVEEQQLFNKLLNIFNYHDEVIDIDYDHREVALTELVWLIKNFYASKHSLELENFLKEIVKLIKKQKTEIKFGLKALLMLLPILNPALLVEIVEAHKLPVILLSLIRHGDACVIRDAQVRHSVLKALQLFAYKGVGIDIETIKRITLRLVDNNESFKNRAIALDILTLLIVQGVDLRPLELLKADTKELSCPLAWVILESFQKSYDTAQNVEILNTLS